MKQVSDKPLAIISGIILISLVALGSIHIDIMPDDCIYDSSNTPIKDIGKQEYLGTISLEDLGIHTRNYHHELDVVTTAEDEYWEIEKLGNNYYRVRREDNDDGLNGHYEFDTEEYIGDVEALYKYAKEHNIIQK